MSVAHRLVRIGEDIIRSTPTCSRTSRNYGIQLNPLNV